MINHVPVPRAWLSPDILVFVLRLKRGVRNLQSEFLAKSQKVQAFRVHAVSTMLATLDDLGQPRKLIHTT